MSYLRENKRQDKLRTDLLKMAVSKDETRIHLNSIWHDSALKGLVATNGHIATVLCSRYSEELKDILICPKTFTHINREKVKISAVVPVKFKHEIAYKIESYHYVKQVKSKVTKTHFYDDGSITVNEILELDGKKRLFSVNADFLKYLVGQSFTFGINADLSPVVVALAGDNLHGDIFIIMPLKGE